MADKKETTHQHLPDGLVVPGRVGKSKEDWIGSQLKRVYDEALTESIPDDMLSLLDQLDAAPSSGKKDPAGEENTQ